MAKNKVPKPAVDVLQGLLEKGNSPLAADFKRYRLKLDWESIVGSTIASKCSPVGYARGVLYVWVVNATWMNQLVFVRKELTNKINAHLGQGWTKEIRFTQDKRDVPSDALSKQDP